MVSGSHCAGPMPGHRMARLEPVAAVAARHRDARLGMLLPR